MQTSFKGKWKNDYYNIKICIIYLDDIIIFAKDFEEHLERLDVVLTRLKEYNLKLSIEKCFFMQKKVKFLGHVVSEFAPEIGPVKCLGHTASKVGNGPDPDKIERVKVSSQPTTHRIEFCPTSTTNAY